MRALAFLMLPLFSLLKWFPYFSKKTLNRWGQIRHRRYERRNNVAIRDFGLQTQLFILAVPWWDGRNWKSGTRGWWNGSAAKSICSCWGSGVDPQQPHGSLQLLVFPAPGDSACSSGVHRYHTHVGHRHTNTPTTNTHKIENALNSKNKSGTWQMEWATFDYYL